MVFQLLSRDPRNWLLTFSNALQWSTALSNSMSVSCSFKKKHMKLNLDLLDIGITKIV